MAILSCLSTFSLVDKSSIEVEDMFLSRTSYTFSVGEAGYSSLPFPVEARIPVELG